jgi:plasmid stabilization system protein ParE
MYILIFHPEALQEYKKAIIWYEIQQKNLGTRYIKLVELTIERIQNNPEHFRISHGKYREAPVPIFPFTIVYKINKSKQTIFIASIFHTSRNPRLKFRMAK